MITWSNLYSWLVILVVLYKISILGPYANRNWKGDWLTQADRRPKQRKINRGEWFRMDAPTQHCPALSNNAPMSIAFMESLPDGPSGRSTKLAEIFLTFAGLDTNRTCLPRPPILKAAGMLQAFKQKYLSRILVELYYLMYIGPLADPSVRNQGRLSSTYNFRPRWYNLQQCTTFNYSEKCQSCGTSTALTKNAH